MVGIITGREINKNRDSEDNRVLLQVEMLEGDVRTVELFCNQGEDINPANGCRVVVIDASDGNKLGIAFTDNLPPSGNPGEKEIYSTDNPVTTKLAKIKLNASSEIILNDGTKSAVNHPDLNAALQTFLTALNAQLVGLGGAGGLTIDLSGSEVSGVKL